ncbi:moesin/ezrin/radixin homolog 1 isoform X2 [Eurytemora carolleeae]|uniref:moesin/ezrin/radixin homolog 1 isoform X2 n=1 Tax=Eurytemora carolleeae TaxID=1294199 RepID=UPI000C7783BF|nr:moesin/ezrin/radixin homolog 1 isoform X2 [Eurytemora carolleeae]|eukprot:XP_023343744.1 moesin/ezrin/radixin homolog 1-like isoform X2 [Eurytemora affinis]
MAPKKGINVRVISLDTELEFTIQPSTTGKILLDQIIQTTGLREIWYFGLQYTDVKGGLSWLKLDKKVKTQPVKKEEPLQFKFRIKYFPEHIVEEIIQEQTLKLLYLQIKSDILSESIYCPPEKAVLLASYYTQVKYGNFDSEVHTSGYLANDSILPRAVIVEHKLSREEWEDKISIFHAKHKGMSKEDAMAEYLTVAQDLETYGITYFQVKNKKGTQLLLGIDALGINIYSKDNKLNPQINFPWSEIGRISFGGDEFIVKMTDKSAAKFVVKCIVAKESKKIYDLASGNHEMYMRRRRPDTMEVQQMRSQKKEMIARKLKEKEELQKEISARAKVEQQKKELEARYKEMEDRMNRREEELNKANLKIEELERQLREIKEAKEDLEKQQKELKTMMEELESAKSLEYEQRTRMEREISEKQEEIERIQSLVSEKENESKRLQEEVEEARQRMEKNEADLRRELENSKVRIVEEYSYQRNGVAESVSSDSGTSDEGSKGDEEEEAARIPEIIVDPVEEREVGMKDEMKSLLRLG